MKLLANKLNLMPALAGFGAFETGYLAIQKLQGSTPLCLDGGCNDVLTGPYSTLPFINIPLPLIGFAAYAIIAMLSMNSLDKKPTQDIVLFLSTSMATFSAYLMILLTFILHASCPYCYLSAAISTALAITAWDSKIVPNINRAFGIATSAAAITFLSSIALFLTTNVLIFTGSAEASTAPLAQIMAAEPGAKGVNKPPKLTKTTTPEALAVAKQLKDINAKMYGAYWCSHCFNQKDALGMSYNT